MERVRLELGGLGVSLEGGASVAEAMRLPGMEVFRTEAGGTDLVVALDCALPAVDFQVMHTFSIVDGEHECRFGMDAKGTYWYDFGGEGCLRYDERKGHRVELSPMRSTETLRFALWCAIAMGGLPMGVVPVHSSVVVCDGKAVMCLGESGTGKSTHTRLWLEHIGDTHLLNDDSPLLRATEEGVWVYGSPWSGKTPCYRKERYPVAGLLRLEQRKENSIRSLRTLEAFGALQPSCPPSLAKEEHCLDLLVEFISRVLEHVPVYRMGCLPDGEAAQMSHDTILGALDKTK